MFFALFNNIRKIIYIYALYIAKYFYPMRGFLKPYPFADLSGILKIIDVKTHISFR